MNTLLTICIGALVAIVSCAPQDEKMLDIKNKCLEETGATDEMISDTMAGKFTTDPALGKYFVCTSKREGILDSDGHVHKDILKQKLLQYTDNEAGLDAAIEKCTFMKGTIEESALESVKCMMNELKP